MKLISSLQTASQWLAVRLYTRGNSRSDRQRGASALEYIMLAAVIIAILVYLSTNTSVRNSIVQAFQGVFDAGKEAASEAAGGS